MVRDYLNNYSDSGEEIYRDMICKVMGSVAKMCIIPMQDYFGYDNTCRMNQPSTLGKNWKWRMTEGELTEELIQKIRDITARYGRL